MRVTSKGQVTIPRHIRHKLGIREQTEVEFVERDNLVVLVKKSEQAPDQSKFHRYRGKLRQPLSTEEIMALTRSDT